MTDKTQEYIRKTIPTLAQDIPRSMAYASPWADFILYDKTDRYAWTAPLHFAYSDRRTCSPFDVSRDCPEGQCIVTAITSFAIQASDHTLSPSKREEAVKFLIHLMADIHQPMHIGFFEDDGGTKIYIPNMSTTLHNVWDESLYGWFLEGANEKSSKVLNYYDVFESILNKMKLSTAPGAQNKAKFFSKDDLASEEQLQSRIKEIASETTREVTCGLAYKHADGSWIESMDNLDEDYFKSRSKAMFRQFARAGRRLAELLDAVAIRYSEGKRAACLAAAQAKKNAPVVIKPTSVNRPANSFAALFVEDCVEEETAVPAELSEEDVLRVEKKIMFGEKKPVAKKQKSKKSKQKNKTLSLKQFDAILDDFKQRNPDLYTVEV